MLYYCEQNSASHACEIGQQNHIARNVESKSKPVNDHIELKEEHDSEKHHLNVGIVKEVGERLLEKVLAFHFI